MGKYCRFIGHDAVIVNLSGLFDIFFFFVGWVLGEREIIRLVANSWVTRCTSTNKRAEGFKKITYYFIYTQHLRGSGD